MATAAQSLHQQLKTQTHRQVCCVAPAVLITTTALAVIVCASLCLAIPGVNAMTQVFYPAILPSLIAIIFCVPFLIQAVRHNSREKQIREQFIEALHEPLNASDPNASKQDLIDLISKDLPESTIESTKILTDLRNKYPKQEADRNPLEQKIVDAIDAAMKKINGAEEDD